jgi:hypothetical protein
VGRRDPSKDRVEAAIVTPLFSQGNKILKNYLYE